ncbi:hypothetical protein [Coleofasciculus sp. E1-EBD-02]|uniref:hypothetical protein n=1 Tax=Coleofasciculus sp. E1-EBD-02 TaxID=3068481 RepID=UPI0032F35CCA
MLRKLIVSVFLLILFGFPAEAAYRYKITWQHTHRQWGKCGEGGWMPVQYPEYIYYSPIFSDSDVVEIESDRIRSPLKVWSSIDGSNCSYSATEFYYDDNFAIYRNGNLAFSMSAYLPYRPPSFVRISVGSTIAYEKIECPEVKIRGTVLPVRRVSVRVSGNNWCQ